MVIVQVVGWGRLMGSVIEVGKEARTHAEQQIYADVTPTSAWLHKASPILPQDAISRKLCVNPNIGLMKYRVKISPRSPKKGVRP